MFGGIIDGKRLPLLHLEDRLTRRVYVERILEGHVVPFITSTEKEPCHSSTGRRTTTQGYCNPRFFWWKKWNWCSPLACSFSWHELERGWTLQVLNYASVTHTLCKKSIFSSCLLFQNWPVLFKTNHFIISASSKHQHHSSSTGESWDRMKQT